MTYLICKDCGDKELSEYYSIDILIICKACEAKRDAKKAEVTIAEEAKGRGK